MSEVVKAAQAGMVYATIPLQFISLFAMKVLVVQEVFTTFT